MWKIALKSTLAKKRRLFGTALSVMIGVAFLVGTLVFTDTIRRTFDDLFAGIYADTDSYVRAEANIDVGSGSQPAWPDTRGHGGDGRGRARRRRRPRAGRRLHPDRRQRRQRARQSRHGGADAGNEPRLGRAEPVAADRRQPCARHRRSGDRQGQRRRRRPPRGRHGHGAHPDRARTSSRSSARPGSGRSTRRVAPAWRCSISRPRSRCCSAGSTRSTR